MRYVFIAVGALFLQASGLFAQPSPWNRNPSLSSELDQVIPYIATGAGWTTSITIINRDDDDELVTIRLFNEGGEPVALDTVQFGRIDGEKEIVVPVGKTVTIDFLPTAQYQVNWAYFDTWAFCSVVAKLRYAQFFDTLQYGRVLLEHQALLVSSSAYDDDFLVSFNTLNGDDILYLVNPRDWASEAFVNLEVLVEGEEPRVLTVKVPPMKRTSHSLRDLLGNTSGSIRIVSNEDIAGVLLDLDGSSFTMVPLVP